MTTVQGSAVRSSLTPSRKGLSSVFGIISLPVSPHFLLGRGQWFILVLSVSLIKDIFLLELSERVQIVPGSGVYSISYIAGHLSPPLRSLATF
jgi:hypothetical protein